MSHTHRSAETEAFDPAGARGADYYHVPGSDGPASDEEVDAQRRVRLNPWPDKFTFYFSAGKGKEGDRKG